MDDNLNNDAKKIFDDEARALEFDAKNIFDDIVKQTELIMAARKFDNVDHNGDNVPNASQMAAAAEIMSKARELRRILRGV